MTEKRFEIIREVYQCYKDLTLYEISNGEHAFYVYDKPVDCSGTAQELCDLLNEQQQTIRTLGIAIDKILQAIKNDKEGHAVIMCIEVLKKLEEEGYLND